MLFPVLVAVGGYGVEEVVAIAALAVVVIARHAANLRRLFQGRELRTGNDGRARPERPRWRDSSGSTRARSRVENCLVRPRTLVCTRCRASTDA